MADVDKDSKTEEATPKKLEQLREQGQVAKSADVAGAATVVSTVAILAVMGGGFADAVTRFTERIFRLRDVHRPFEALETLGQIGVEIVGPIAGAAAVAAIVATVVQTKGLFALASLQPKPERMNPIEGLKKILPGPQMLVELGKSLLKVGLVGILVWRVIDDGLPRFVVLPMAETEAGAAEVGAIAAKLVLWGVAALTLLAALDYVITWRRFAKQNRMAKHEVKEEHKQSEGDPHIKGKRRQKQRELANQRSVQAVEDATCLVTNPTHIAVAIRYEPDQGDAAPIMLGSGVEEVALRMRAEARKKGIPIVENKPLARALRATGKPGRPIPVELYEIAAKVIAHVMGIRGGK